jgi:integrase/recombinase XerD
VSKSKIYLTKRTNGYYYIGYDDNGRLRWKSTGEKTKPEALEFIKTFVPNSEQTKTELKMSQLLELFTQLHGNSLRKRTLTGYQDSANEFIKILGDKLISQYTSQDIETYKNVLLSNGLAPTSVNFRYRSVKSILGWATSMDHIPTNPFRKSKAIKIAQKTPIYLTKEDLSKLLAKVDNQLFKDIFLFAALTGLRLSELVNLKKSSIDWKQSQIIVSNDEDFTTKSGKQRVIPIHTLLIDVLKRREARTHNSIYIFAKTNGYKFSPSFLSHKFKFYVGEAKLDQRLHFHSLRHTNASLLVGAGVSVFEVQKLLGHSSVQTTMIYAHLGQSKLAESVNKVEL